MSWYVTIISFIRNGGEDVTKDLEFTELEQCYKILVKAAEEFRLEVIAYRGSLSSMLSYQMECATDIAKVCGLSPTNDEGLSEQPYQEHDDAKIPFETKQCLEDYATAMAYCKQEVMAVLDDIDANVIGPLDNFHQIAKVIDKTIVKREHKLIDYDRHRLSYMKYADIQYPTPSEEKNLLKLQTLYDNAAYDYDYFNTMLKKELVVFIDLLRADFMGPVMERFYNAQCSAAAGIYGRLSEVIQQNEIVFSTLHMPIEEGYNLRLAEKNAREELDKLDLLKKGLKLWQQKDPSLSSRYRKSPFDSPSQDDQEPDRDDPQNSRYSSVGRRYSSTITSKSQRNDGLRETMLSVPDGIGNMDQKSRKSRSSSEEEPPALTPRPSIAALRNRLLSNSSESSTPSYHATASLLPSSYTKQQSQQQKLEKRTFASNASSHTSLSAGITSNTSSTPATPSSTQFTACSSSPFDDQIEVVAKKKRPPPPPPPSKKLNKEEQSSKKELVEALYDLKGPQEGDLSFKVGDLIEVLDKSEKVNDWWKGRLNGQVGMFPANYVRLI
ncbi:hypothetical protein BDF20DRAFT_1005218 [Mycotypha africana]|uniref:uncharacterized protein n=1 Tax=Mycotypha africana TaxID=64632 RepID=UPI0023008546|nr:uncharacterized protein BDF20DRAFT_1005218 [Mycotypha africana]KAI8966903.1 hypothetical protein BDF20DRAFT_1005218 [Mycotypha africana]